MGIVYHRWQYDQQHQLLVVSQLLPWETPTQRLEAYTLFPQICPMAVLYPSWATKAGEVLVEVHKNSAGQWGEFNTVADVLEDHVMHTGSYTITTKGKEWEISEHHKHSERTQIRIWSQLKGNCSHASSQPAAEGIQSSCSMCPKTQEPEKAWKLLGRRILCWTTRLGCETPQFISALHHK